MAGQRSSKSEKSANGWEPIIKLLSWALATFIGVGGVGLLWDWYFSQPKIMGSILTVVVGSSEELAIVDSGILKKMKSASGFHVFVYLTNQHKSPVHVIKNDFEIDVGDGKGFLKLPSTVVQKSVKDANLFGEQYDIHISNYNTQLLLLNKNPVSYGIPIYGICIFSSDKPIEYYSKFKNPKYRLTITDALKNRHVIESSEDDFMPPEMLPHLFDIELQRKDSPVKKK